jgi:hypothetical protein
MIRSATTNFNPLTFTSINDSPSNPRRGLGYAQLFDKTHFVPLMAPLPEVVRAGDIATLYWDNSQVQSYSLDAQTLETGWLSFAVSTALVHPPQGTVYYELRDPESGDIRTSPVRTIRVNLDVPGGLDPNTSTAINEALAAATVKPSPINSPDTPVTVEVPAWLHMEAGDELTVFWNGIPVKAPPLQAVPIEKMLERALKSGVLRRLFRRPLGSVTLESLVTHFSTAVKTLTAINEPQIVPIPKETLIAGGSSDKLLVNYEIRDIVDNYSLVSQPAYALVNVDPDALTAPRVDQADPQTLVLNLETLGTQDVTVTIPSYLGNGSPYEVTLVWVGKTPTTEITLTLPPQSVADPAFDHATFVIPNADIKDIAGGSAVVSYHIDQTGDTRKTSKTTSITLTGLPVQLAAPVISEANGTATVDLSLIAGDHVTVLIPVYLGQAAGDKILLSWKGTPAAPGSAPVHYTVEWFVPAGGELTPATFNVPLANLTPLVGGSLELSYQVVFTATGNTRTSPVTVYSVVDNAAVVVLKITAVTTPAGEFIANGGTTTSTTLNVGGTLL